MSSSAPSPPEAIEPLFLAGPTGSGKSTVALALAEALGRVEIVNADAFQVYEGLETVTASPTPGQRAAAPHHLYSVLAATEPFSAAAFAERALPCLADISARGNIPLVVGGTGLYLKALTHGLSDLPPADPALREQLDALELDDLVAWLQKVDPAGAAQTNLANPRYVQRALEITLQAGRPASVLKDDWRRDRPASSFRGVLLTRDREDLYARIDSRVDEMVRAGLLEEVRALGKISGTAEKAIGIAEARRHLAGEINLEECVAAIRQATRRFAKRQLTWFRRESGFQELHVSPEESPESVAHRILKIYPALQ